MFAHGEETQGMATRYEISDLWLIGRCWDLYFGAEAVEMHQRLLSLKFLRSHLEIDTR